ncbi:c-type cytochrome [Algihabitans albus]|uniref:c-type cytochrome n=1 Tax=Algihabitans albus TaxID=2164067 RepID=UPI000E5CC062|nr:cytochrome c [Algihabitans albus]
MKYRFAAVALLLVGSTLGLVALLRPPGVQSTAIDPNDIQMVNSGARIYAAECATCHGAELEGQTNWRQRNAAGRLPAPPHDPSGHTWHHPDAHLFAMTKQGIAALAGAGYQSDMPAYGETLSDAEILAVLSYIKSTWPPEIQARHDEINRRFQAAQD